MKIYAQLTILILFLSSTVWAATNFTGIWRGVGTAIDSSGYQYPDCSIEFEFKQNANEFSVVQGHYDCGFTREYGSSSFEITGEDLFFNGEKVGTFKESKVQAVISAQGVETTYEIELLDEKSLSYQEKILFEDTQGTITVQGLLKKQ